MNTIEEKGWENKKYNGLMLTRLDRILCEEYSYRADYMMEELKQTYSGLLTLEFSLGSGELTTENFKVVVKDGRITDIFYKDKQYV